MIWVCRRGAHLNPLAGRERDWPQIHFVDLLMEIPQDCRRRDEELERKARFFAKQKMRPKTKYQSKDRLPAAYAKCRFRPKGRT
jgi:hypothetical protein